MRININADLGESWGPYTIGSDSELLRIVASANVACGGHGGDPLVLLRTLREAKAQGVSVGAHPGYADLHGFGRRAMTLSEPELEALLVAQIGTVIAAGQYCDWPVSHVKPHGALNNQACADAKLAMIIARTVARLDPALILLAPAQSELAKAGSAAGLPVRLEVFADRTYESDGQLTPRAIPGSVLHEADAAVAHVLAMVENGGLVTRQGAVIPTDFHSICVHGDGADAVATARAVRAALTAAGHEVCTLPETV